ncbi:MAG: winged helix-turn-helix domain-containing protein [Bdellovibrionota bacterium]
MTKALVLASQFKTALAMRCLLMTRGFTVTVCSSLKDAKKILAEAHFGLILIDIHKQDENAFDFVRNLRNNGSFLPVLYIGERSYQDALILGTTGLDEFLLKPLNLREFDRCLAKTLAKTHHEQRPLLYGGISLDEHHRILSVKNKMVNLGRMEMKILSLLAKKAGNVVSLDRIQVMVEKEGVRFNNRVFYHVSCLRKKLEDAGIHTLQINFVKDGYRLDVV